MAIDQIPAGTRVRVSKSLMPWTSEVRRHRHMRIRAGALGKVLRQYNRNGAGRRFMDVEIEAEMVHDGRPAGNGWNKRPATVMLLTSEVEVLDG